MNEVKQLTILNLVKRFIASRKKSNANTIGLTIYYINLIKLNEGL